MTSTAVHMHTAAAAGADMPVPEDNTKAIGDENNSDKPPAEPSSDSDEVVEPAAVDETDRGGNTNKLQPVKSTGSQQAVDTRTKVIIVTALCMNLFLSALDQTIVATALPRIVEDLGDAVAYSWVGSSYLIAASSFIPSWGKFSDIWGRKPVIMAASAIFLIGSIITSAAQNMGMLIAGRTIQGLGGGGIVVLVNITVSDIVTMRERGKYLAGVGSTWALASALGPILGGVFATKASWRWCFIINLPIGILAMIVIFFFLNLHSPTISLREGLKKIDWLGSFLAIVGTTLFLVGLDFGGVSAPWDSALVLCCMILGILLLVAFVFVEWKVAKTPIMPPRIFGNRTAAASYAVCFFHGQVFIAGAFYLPLYFQSALGQTALISGVLTLPFVVMLSLGSVGTGIFIAKTGLYRPPIWTGLTLMVLGVGLFVNLNRTSSYAKIIMYQFVTGLGVGPIFQGPLIAIHSTISPKDIGTATGAFAFTRNIAAAIGVSLGNVIFANQLQKQIPHLMTQVSSQTLALIAGSSATANTETVRKLPDAQRIPLQDAYASALSVMWWYFLGCAIASLLFSGLIQKHVLSTKLQSNQPAKARKRHGSANPKTEVEKDVA